MALEVFTDTEHETVRAGAHNQTLKRTQRNSVEGAVIPIGSVAPNFLIVTLEVNTFGGGQIPTSVEILSGNANSKFRVHIAPSKHIQLLVDNAAAVTLGTYPLTIRITYGQADLQQDRRVVVVVV